MAVMRKNNVRVRGQGSRPIVFAHGYGCDQPQWRNAAPAFGATAGHCPNLGAPAATIAAIRAWLG